MQVNSERVNTGTGKYGDRRDVPQFPAGGNSGTDGTDPNSDNATRYRSTFRLWRC
jgi:hypothetical protein